jgi:peptidoglycan/LPS O-acetylase OafA/YrhL
MTKSRESNAKEHFLWLDIARVLCAVMILGFHWLRPGYKLGLFGPAGFNLIMSYQTNTNGTAMFKDIFIAGFAPRLDVWLTNIIAIFGGFGWEAVSALVLISGFSLAISQKNKVLSFSEWRTWYRKRAVRILVPFYLIAIPCLLAAVLALLILHSAHGHIAEVLSAKLHSQFQGPILGVILSHLFLFDPYQAQWSANFFVPAWWFIPAILLAYVTYPWVRRFSRIGHGIPLLILSAAITIVATLGSNAGILLDECWYFIILHLSFNFSLGVVIANLWLGDGRATLERGLSNPMVFLVAILAFILGNLANWTNETRPFASMLFGPSLVVIIACISKYLENWRHARKLVSVDPYDLYLVHQPFAFPIALLSKLLFHSYAVFLGWFIFVAVAVAAARILSVAQKPPFAKRLPSRSTFRPLRAERAS